MLTFVTFAMLKPGCWAIAAMMATLTSSVRPSAGTAGAGAPRAAPGGAATIPAGAPGTIRRRSPHQWPVQTPHKFKGEYSYGYDDKILP